MDKDFLNILNKYPDKSGKDLIPVLQDLQNKFGYISEKHINDLSNQFDLACSKIYSVATYYNQFRFSPNTKTIIKICEGSACHAFRSHEIHEELLKQLRINENGVSSDGNFSIERVPCFGACALAPVIEINGTFYTRLNKRKLIKILNDLKEKHTI